MKIECVFQKAEESLLDLHLFIRYFDFSDLEFLGVGSDAESLRI
jgi:hypothetical protein